MKVPAPKVLSAVMEKKWGDFRSKYKAMFNFQPHTVEFRLVYR